MTGPWACTLTCATPSAFATMLSMSPAWWVGVPTLPCGSLVGSKWPPALLASAALQSPFSWIWMAWVLFGARPPTSPCRCRPSPIGITDNRLLTRLPDAAARLTWALDTVEVVAMALLGADAAAGVPDAADVSACGVVLQAARTRALALASSAVFMAVSGSGQWGGTLARAGFNRSEPRSAAGALRLQFTAERVAANPQQRSGLGAAATGVLQRRFQQHPIEMLQRLGMDGGVSRF